MGKLRWNAPPRCSGDETDGICMMCGLDQDTCRCSACPTCGSVGDPRCHAIPAAIEEIENLTAWLASAEAENSELRRTLILAWSELCQWERLAEYQREMIPLNQRWCPTQAGMDESAATRDQISAVLTQYKRPGVPGPSEE